MNIMEQIIALIQSWDAYVLLVLCLVCIILIMWNIMLASRLKKLGLKKNAKIADGGIMEIVGAIDRQNETSIQLKEEIRKIIDHLEDQEKYLDTCFQKIGVVRYNAFTDVAGEQSIAFALLDAHNNGIVVNIVNSRQDSSVYAKSIEKGIPERALSDEEAMALKKALD